MKCYTEYNRNTLLLMKYAVYSLNTHWSGLYTHWSVQWVVRKGRNHVFTWPMDLGMGLQNWKRFVNQTKTPEETAIFSCSPLACISEVLLWAGLSCYFYYCGVPKMTKHSSASSWWCPCLLQLSIYTFFLCFLLFGPPFGRDNLHTSLYFYSKYSLARSFASSSNKSFSVEFLGHFKEFWRTNWLKVKGRMFNWVSHGQDSHNVTWSLLSHFKK